MVVNLLSLSQHAKERASQGKQRQLLSKQQQTKRKTVRSSRKSSVLSSLGKFLDDEQPPSVDNKNPSLGYETESTFQQSFSSNETGSLTSFLKGDETTTSVAAAASSTSESSSSAGVPTMRRRCQRRGSVTKYSLHIGSRSDDGDDCSVMSEPVTSAPLTTAGQSTRTSRPPLTRKNLVVHSTHPGCSGTKDESRKKRGQARLARGNNNHDDDEEDDRSVISVQSTQSLQTIDSMPIPMKTKGVRGGRRPKKTEQQCQSLSNHIDKSPSSSKTSSMPVPTVIGGNDHDGRRLSVDSTLTCEVAMDAMDDRTSDRPRRHRRAQRRGSVTKYSLDN